MIALIAFKEKIRRKVFFAVFALAALITLIFSTGAATVTINGESVTDYKILMPTMLTVMNAASCAMAVALSLNTIPKEYERHTNQLIFIRGVSQSRYHIQLAIANITASLVSHAIFFSGLAVYIITSKNPLELLWAVPSYLYSGIGIVLVSLFTTCLSIVFSEMAAGVISVVIMLIGVFYPMIELLKGIAGGLSGKIFKALLFVLPNLHGIQSAAGCLITEHTFDLHIMFVALFYVYLFALGIILFRRKED